MTAGVHSNNMPLYYVLLNANESIKSPNAIPPGFKGTRFLLAVEAEDEHAAREKILASYSELSREKNFGEVMVAQTHKNGWTLTLPD